MPCELGERKLSAFFVSPRFLGLSDGGQFVRMTPDPAYQIAGRMYSREEISTWEGCYVLLAKFIFAPLPPLREKIFGAVSAIFSKEKEQLAGRL